MIIINLPSHSSETFIPRAIRFREAGKRCSGSPNALRNWVLPTTSTPFIICRNLYWRLDIELGLAYVIVRHENGSNQSNVHTVKTVLCYLTSCDQFLTPHAQVVWLQERYSLLMVMNKHVTLKWSSSDSGLKNLWRVLYGVSCTWLPMADSICWMHLLSLGLPRAAFRKLRERQMQSTPFIFIFLQTYDTYERKKYSFDDDV